MPLLGGSFILAVVGLGLGAAALAVAVAALAAPALIACLSEVMLPRGATVGFVSHGFSCSGVACSFFSVSCSFLCWLCLLFRSFSFHTGQLFPSAICLLLLSWPWSLFPFCLLLFPP